MSLSYLIHSIYGALNWWADDLNQLLNGRVMLWIMFFDISFDSVPKYQCFWHPYFKLTSEASLPGSFQAVWAHPLQRERFLPVTVHTLITECGERALHQFALWRHLLYMHKIQKHIENKQNTHTNPKSTCINKQNTKTETKMKQIHVIQWDLHILSLKPYIVTLH